MAERSSTSRSALLEAFAAYLGIETERLRLSELGTASGGKEQLVLDICLAVGADVYLSGSGAGRDYNDEQLLRENGIELRYDEFRYPEHPQLWGAFEPDLSILDLLFNCGPASRDYVIDR